MKCAPLLPKYRNNRDFKLAVRVTLWSR